MGEGEVERVRELLVTVVDGGSAAVGFLGDIVGMLWAIAEREGVPLDGRWVSDTCWSGRAPTSVDLTRVLASEVGVHRAQVARAPLGRIVTYKVLVGVTPPGPNVKQPVVRTYSYPQGTVALHASGTKAELAQVLAGHVRA